MRAGVRVVVVCLAAGAALVALPAVAQPTQPCMNGGSLGPCPAWVDNNENGQWDPGDSLITFADDTSSDNGMYINSPWGTGWVFFDFYPARALREKSAAPDPYDTASWSGWCAEILNQNGDGDAIQFGLWQGGCSSGTSLLAGTYRGFMNLVDGNGDDAVDGLELWEATPLKTLAAQEPWLETDIICTDVGDDGVCDHISLPWTDTVVPQIRMDPEEGQVWVPINQSGPDAGRMTFGLPVSGGTIPRSVAFAARTAAEGIPTLTQWGALASLLGLAFAGWWLLRRRQAIA